MIMDILNEYLEFFKEDTICHKHAIEIQKSHIYIDVVSSIINDMLMGRVYVENEKIYLKLNERICQLISDWYDLSGKLSVYNNKNIVVYRGVFNMTISKNKILQPIPFSTCIDFDNSLNWINPKDPNSFIMKININSGCEYTYTCNLNEGNEVVLPAGFLTKINEFKEKECNIFEYDFEPFTYLQMIENFDKINIEFY